MLGPNSRPSDLADRLAAAGMVKGVELAGLVFRDITVPFPVDPDIVVREATPEDAVTIQDITALGFGFPEAVAELFSLAALQPSEYRIRAYLAYIPGTDTPGAPQTTRFASYPARRLFPTREVKGCIPRWWRGV
jgi:hypothetical protein